MEQWEGAAYCVKCKCQVSFTGHVEVKNGRRFAKGNCPICDTKVTRILGKRDDVAPSQPDPEVPILDQRSGYGSPYENHRRIAALWSAYLGTEVRAHQIAWCMTLVKMSRSVSSPGNPDHYLDGKAYIDIAEQCYNEDPRV